MRPTVTFTGRVHTAPEVSSIGTDGRMCRFSVATAHYRRDRKTRDLTTDYDIHVCVSYTPELITILQKQAFKGRLVTVSGQLTYRAAIHRQGRDAEILIDRSAGIEFLDTLTTDGEVIERVEVVPSTLAPPAAAITGQPAQPVAPRVMTTAPGDEDDNWL